MEFTRDDRDAFVARRVGEKLGPDCVLASFSQATCGGYGVSETL
jgi:hypothetical protein